MGKYGYFEIEQTDNGDPDGPVLVTLRLKSSTKAKITEEWKKHKTFTSSHRPVLFTCVSCTKDIYKSEWPCTKDWLREIGPICKSCERLWSRGTGRPSGGDVISRRRAMQISILADLITQEASNQKWRKKHG